MELLWVGYISLIVTFVVLIVSYAVLAMTLDRRVRNVLKHELNVVDARPFYLRTPAPALDL